ncbi:MAG: glycosyltransferase [Clostridia bacterium]|nr:glycosyltransferase [Clostridia bacterium]
MENNNEKQTDKDLTLKKQKTASNDSQNNNPSNISTKKSEQNDNNGEYKRRPKRNNNNRHKPKNKPVDNDNQEEKQSASVNEKPEQQRSDNLSYESKKQNNSASLSRLWIIIPCYNEENVLPITSQLFLDELNDLIKKRKISKSSRILFVNDGSKDSTWEIIKDLAKSDPHFIGICQSRNRGHQNAVLAGLMEAKDKADITISIDCDGQDDIAAMEAMVDEYHNGNEVVYGVRSKRDTDTFFKRFTAEGFYKLLNLMGAEVVFNHADYRLISSRVLKEFAEFHEVNLFLRGLVPLVGFKSTSVYYERHERIAGESHYPLSKMLSLAFDGITSLSVKPIQMITAFGGFVAVLSFIGILWAVISVLAGLTVHGWASMTCIICFFSGIQLISLGIIGNYIGKIYMEVKHRPRYIISERTWEKNKKDF